MKPGYKTTEFWLTVVANFLLNSGAVSEPPARYRAIATALTVIGYAFARAITKYGAHKTNTPVTGVTQVTGQG